MRWPWLPVRRTRIYLMARRWQLTNTRYLLGPAGFLDVLNEQLDPLQHRFRIVQRFDILPKPGIEGFHNGWKKSPPFPENEGDCALFEFTGALPRAKLYSNWQVSTNDDATLKTLTSTNFDPQQPVLVSTPLPAAPAVNATNENPGTVEFKSYAPKNIVLEAKPTRRRCCCSTTNSTRTGRCWWTANRRNCCAAISSCAEFI